MFCSHYWVQSTEDWKDRSSLRVYHYATPAPAFSSVWIFHEANEPTSRSLIEDGETQDEVKCIFYFVSNIPAYSYFESARKTEIFFRHWQQDGGDYRMYQSNPLVQQVSTSTLNLCLFLFPSCREFGLHPRRQFASFSDAALDDLVREYINHNQRLGLNALKARLFSREHHVQRWRIRESMLRVDPGGVAIRTTMAISRRTYTVAGPNSGTLTLI